MIYYFGLVQSKAFFSIPIHEDSQYLFALSFESSQFKQCCLPQGFCENQQSLTKSFTNI